MSIGQIHLPHLVGGWCCTRNDLMKLLFNYQYSLVEVDWKKHLEKLLV